MFNIIKLWSLAGKKVTTLEKNVAIFISIVVEIIITTIRNL